MTLNEIPKVWRGGGGGGRVGLPPQTPLGGLTAPPPKPPAVCTKPLRGFVFPRYARPQQFLGGSTAPDEGCCVEVDVLEFHIFLKSMIS